MQSSIDYCETENENTKKPECQAVADVISPSNPVGHGSDRTTELLTRPTFSDILLHRFPPSLQPVKLHWLSAVPTAELRSSREFRQFLLRCPAATANTDRDANKNQEKCKT